MIDRYTKVVLTLIAAGLLLVGGAGLGLLLAPAVANAYTMKSEVEIDLNPQPVVMCRQASVGCGPRQDYGEDCTQFRVREESYSGTPQCECFSSETGKWEEMGPALVKWVCK